MGACPLNGTAIPSVLIQIACRVEPAAAREPVFYIKKIVVGSRVLAAFRQPTARPFINRLII